MENSIENCQVPRKLSKTESQSVEKKNTSKIFFSQECQPLMIYHSFSEDHNYFVILLGFLLQQNLPQRSYNESHPQRNLVKLQMRQGMHFSPGQELMIFRQNFHGDNP